MNQRPHSITASCCLSILLVAPVIAGADEVVFDLPPVAEAVLVPQGDKSINSSPHRVMDTDLVTIRLRLSSMIESPEVPRIDQWLVRCQPRDHQTSVFDFSPRTETASDLASPIQVKRTEEQSQKIGFSIHGSAGHAAQGDGGADQSTKNVRSVQYDRVAPVQAVAVAGTINRGRGVYFKLRWTAQQVLEGEKTFSITLQVPPSWRGGLMDVTVLAQSDRKSFGGWERESKTLGAAHFVVGVYRQGDRTAAEGARSLAQAEDELRGVASRYSPTREVNSWPTMLRQVAAKLAWESSPSHADWMRRLLSNRADPHLDQEIRRLPMPIRVAVLDYVDVRDDFAMLNGDGGERHAQRRVLVAKPALE